jgi:hypothetical protein
MVKRAALFLFNLPAQQSKLRFNSRNLVLLANFAAFMQAIKALPFHFRHFQEILAG